MGRRGILPSLGAGTSLIVAGVLCLVVISSIIAFRGFPGLGPDVPRPPLRLADPAADRTGDAASKPILIGAGTGTATLAVPVRRVQHRAGAADAARSARSSVRIDTPRGTTPSAPSPTTPSPSTPSPATGSPTTGSPAIPSPSTPPASHPRPVRDAVDHARGLLPPVEVPPVPPAVQPVADQVQQTVDTVSDTVDQAAGVVDDTVNQATGAVGGLLP